MQKKRKLAKAIIESRSNSKYSDEMIEVLIKENLSSTPPPKAGEKVTFGEKMADKLAHRAGSWAFLIIFTFVLAVWIAFNGFILKNPFDPYPFILLNLFLSLIASIQAPIIMMSQNREAKIDREHGEYEYKVNLKSEILLEEIYTQIEEIKKEIQELKKETK